jgi:hypothetical protein
VSSTRLTVPAERMQSSTVVRVVSRVSSAERSFTGVLQIVTPS